MSIADRMQPVEVPVSGCRCIGAPHTNDSVFLAPKLTAPMAYAAFAMMNAAGPSPAARTAALGTVWRELGVVAWSFLDQDGEPVPITPDSLEEYLPWNAGGFAVAQRADELYSEDLVAPLVQRSRRSSLDTPTEPSISANGSTQPQPHKPSKPSSPQSTDGNPSEALAP